MKRLAVLLALLPALAFAQAAPTQFVPPGGLPASTPVGTAGATLQSMQDGIAQNASNVASLTASSVTQSALDAALTPYLTQGQAQSLYLPLAGDASAASVQATNGIIEATLRNRFSRVLDIVFDGGAKCDGTTDDGPAITTLLNKAAGNATVRIAAGLTCAASTIILPSNTHLTNDGTVIQTPSAQKQFVTANNTNRIFIDGSGTIDGNRSSYASTDTGVYACLNINGTQYFALTGVTVQNCKNYPVNVWNGAAHAYLTNVRLLNSGNSPECALNTDDCWVDHAYISGIQDVGWAFYKGVTNSGITNSRATGNGGAGISSYMDIGTGTWPGNQNILIAHNIADHNGGPGIIEQGNSLNVATRNKGVIVQANIGSYNNQMNQNGYGCIFVANDYYTQIIDNQCSYDGNGSNPVYGIWLQGQNYYPRVSGNQIWNEGIGGTGGVGIWTSGTSYFPTITNNTIFMDQGNTSMAFGISGSVPATSWGLIADNTIRGLPGGAYTNLAISPLTTFRDDTQIQRATASGAAITWANYTGWLFLYQTATVASQTITLPARAGNGQVITLSTAGALTALTIAAPSGLTVLGAPSTLAAGASVSFRFDGPSATWVCV